MSRVSAEQLADVWARLVAGETTVKAEAHRYGYPTIAGLYLRLRKWKGAKVLGPVLRRANHAARTRKRQAKAIANVGTLASTVQHSDPAISPTQSIPVSADRVVLVQRIAQHVSVRTARVEGRAVHAALHLGGTVLLPVTAIADLCTVLRKVARARDRSQGR